MPITHTAMSGSRLSNRQLRRETSAVTRHQGAGEEASSASRSRIKLEPDSNLKMTGYLNATLDALSRRS